MGHADSVIIGDQLKNRICRCCEVNFVREFKAKYFIFSKSFQQTWSYENRWKSVNGHVCLSLKKNFHIKTILTFFCLKSAKRRKLFWQIKNKRICLNFAAYFFQLLIITHFFALAIFWTFYDFLGGLKVFLSGFLSDEKLQKIQIDILNISKTKTMFLELVKFRIGPHTEKHNELKIEFFSSNVFRKFSDFQLR